MSKTGEPHGWISLRFLLSGACFHTETDLSLDAEGERFFFPLRSLQYARFHFPHENKVRLKLHRGIYLFLTPAKPRHLVWGEREKTGTAVRAEQIHA